MQITAEISLYPLQENFEQVIIAFIGELKRSEGIEIYTHSMSTFVKGENALVFESISKALEKTGLNSDTVSRVIKIINRNLPVEQGFLNLD